MTAKTESKESLPKTEPAAMHNMAAGFEPTAAWAAAQQTWQKMMADATGRAQAWANECAAIESQMYARTRAAVDAWHQLARDTIAYSEQLSAQARKMAFEAIRTGAPT